MTNSSTAHSIGSQLDIVLSGQVREAVSVKSIIQRVLTGGMLLDSIVAVSAVAAALIIGFKADAFFAEGAFVTVFSALQIAAIACACVVIYQFRIEQTHSWRGSHLVWALAGVGFSIMVFDEAAGLHEWLDAQLHKVLALRPSPWTDRIDDLIVLAYGLTAVTVAFVYRRELLPLWQVRRPFVIGAVLFGLMVVADLLTNSYSNDASLLAQRSDLALIASLANAFEDTIKLLCEVALFAGLIGVATILSRQRANRYEPG